MSSSQISLDEFVPVCSDVVVRDVLDVDEDLPNHRLPKHSKSVEERWRSTGYGESIYRHGHQWKLDPCEPSHTVTASNRDFHPFEPRGLTIREQARLQSFSDDFVFEGNLAEQQRQVGNAVPPELAESVGEMVLDGAALD